MVKLAPVLSTLKPKKILVAGDFILDSYTFGKSKRISPEAPVPIIQVDHEEERVGGAGNVILNLLSLGMQPFPFGRVGDDGAGQLFLKQLVSEGVDTRWIITEEGFKTPHKRRIIASSQQIVRVDHEYPTTLPAIQEDKVLSFLPEILDTVDFIAVSDYAKGFLTKRVLQTLIKEAKKRDIPVISDPKNIDFSRYAGSFILKPNLQEAKSAANLPDAPLTDVARQIFSQVPIDVLMITRSEDGISFYYPDGRYEDHLAVAKEVKDVTGAGDTVLATLTAACANGIALSEATDLANIAAMCAIEKVGCARIGISDIAKRLIELHAQSKVFDVDKFFTLHHVLKHQDFLLLNIESQCDLSPKLFKAIRHVTSESTKDLVVSVSGPSPDEELVHVLASLQTVRYVVLARSHEAISLFHGLPSQSFLFNEKGLSELSHFV